MTKPSSRSLLALVVLVLFASAGVQWLHARTQARLGSELATVAKAGDIQLLSSETCAYCALARAWLREHGVAHAECFIERDAVCQAAYNDAGSRGTPTVVVRGTVQAGFDAERVLTTLRSG
jgi:glutaredoxin